MSSTKRLSVRASFKLVSHQLNELVSKLEGLAEGSDPSEDTMDYLKKVDAVLRLKKNLLEARLLEEELRQRIQESRGGSGKRQRDAGLTPEAIAEIHRLLGFNGETNSQMN